MSRDPTADEIETIRSLIGRAGSEEELQRWIRLALPRRRGRPPGSNKFGDYDESVILIAEALHHIPDGKLSLYLAIKQIVDPVPGSPAAAGRLRWTGPDQGTSAGATIKRLLKKASDEKVIAKCEEPPTQAEVDELMNWLNAWRLGLDRSD
jgi:hypothetical protein